MNNATMGRQAAMFPMKVLTAASLALAVHGSFAQTAPAGTSSANAAVPNAVDVGELELIPGKSAVTLYGYRKHTCFEPVVRFRVRNKSAGDVKLILFRHNLSAVDSSGKALLAPRFMTSAGVALSDATGDNARTAFTREQGKMVTVSPRQVIEVQLGSQPNRVCYPDGDAELLRTHRPKTLTISGALGVIDVTNAAEVRSFSLLDVPLQVSSR